MKKGNSSYSGPEQSMLTKNMLEFTQAAVLKRCPVINNCESINWDELLDESQNHGLTAWVWEGISKLPIEQQPPRQQRISWALSAQEVVDSYFSIKKVLSDIIELCDDNQIRLLLLKGFGLSRMYPIPQFRSFGDIDIFVFDDYEKLNGILGGENDTSDGKHSEIMFEGVEVENHKTIIYTHTRKYKRANRFIESTLPNAIITEEGYYVLSTEANLVFLLIHALTHLNSVCFLSMRNILDFAMFIYVNQDKLEPSRCKTIMKKLKLSRSFELFVYLSEWVLGITFAEYHFCHIPQKDLKRAYKMIEDKEILNIPPFELPFFTQLKIRWKDYRRSGWKYKYMPTSKMQRIKYHFNLQLHLFIKYVFNIPANIPFRDGIRSKFKK